MERIKSGSILLIFLIIRSISVQAQFNEEVIKKVDAYLATQPEDFHGTILLAVGNRILMNKGYGMADYSHRIRNSADTKYMIGSTTKHFTAILILQLAEKGLIKLDDTIDKYFPGGPVEKTGRITIRHLLLHQSGIPQCYSGFPEYFEKHSRIYHTHDEYLQLIWQSNLRHEPGQGVTYSSPGYYLLGVILERVTRKSYAELLQENIFAPLGMVNTTVDNNLTIRENMATGYQRGVTGIVRSRINEQSNHFAAGDVISTSADLFRFQQWLNFETDKILSEPYKKLLLETQIRFNSNFNATYYGSKYCQFYNNDKDSLILLGVGVSGSFGYRCRMTRFFNEDACYIVLSNIETDNSINEDLFSFLSNILLEELKIDYRFPCKEPAEAPATDYAADQELLTDYAGAYKINENEFIHLSVSGDRLIFQSVSVKWGNYCCDRQWLVPLNRDVFAGTDSNTGYHFKTGSLAHTVKLTAIRKQDTLYIASMLRDRDPADLSSYAGLYYSLENMKTGFLTVTNGKLISDNFLGTETELIYLKEDMFACKQGFLIFNRNADGKIKEFRLYADGIDTYEGVKTGLFEKRTDMASETAEHNSRYE